MTTLSFSQENYPKKIKWGQDTCVLISFDQLKVINKRLLHRRYLLQLNDSLYQYLYKYRSVSTEKQILVDSLKQLSVFYRDKLNEFSREKTILADEKQQLIDKQKRQKKYFWIGLGLSFFTGILFAR